MVCNGFSRFLVAEIILIDEFTFYGLSLCFLPTEIIGIKYMKKSTLCFWEKWDFCDWVACKDDYYFAFE